MKSKASLRCFLAVAGSSLLAISFAPGGTYYWDSDGDGTPGFGTAAGTWQTTAPATNKWSTDPAGNAGAAANYVTTTADDLFFGSATVAYTGATTITGTVDAKSVFQASTHNSFVAGTSPVINFGATGSFETLKTAASYPALAITGAGTSMTWISSRNMNIATFTVNISNASKTILQTSATSTNSYPSRVAMNSASNLGPVGAGLEFNGATLRMNTGFPYTSLSALNTDHPVTFTLNKNSGLDNSIAGSTFTVDLALNLGTGYFYSDGPATNKLTQTNTMAGTYLVGGGTLEISQSDNLGAITSPFTFGSGNAAELAAGVLRIAGTSMTSLGTRPVFTTPSKSMGFDIAAAANTFTVDKILDQTSGEFFKKGIGTLVLNQDNTFTGASTLSGGGTLVLDYTSNNGTKLSDTTALTLSNSDLTLKNGSHPEIVFSTTLSAGHSHIVRDDGTSSINLNVITRAANNGGTISFSADSIAKTDKTNTNGIIAGWATVGSNWAKNSTNGLDGSITALAPGDYTAFVTTGGVNTLNYQLTGAATLTGAVASNSLRIENSADDQILDMGTNVLTCNIGGLLYAGGNNNKYTITGTGAAVFRNATNTETVIHAAVGTLTVNVPVSNGTGPLTKTGAGTLVLGAANTYSGSTYVNQGTLLLNNTTGNGNGTGTVTVYNKATLGGTGTIGGNTTINDGGKLEFDISTAAGSHNKLELAATKTLAFGGVSTLTVTSTGGTPAIGDYVLLTAPGGITGSVPATLNLPVGWAATVTKENTNQDLVLHVTSIGAGGSPEIALDQGGIINSGDAKGFGTVTLGSNTSLTFTINNTGSAALNLTGTPLVAVSGANSADFTVNSPPAASVTVGGSTTFTVQFAPGGTTGGSRNAVLTIQNDDSDEGTFTINVSGTAQTVYEAWSGAADFNADTNGDGVKNGLAFLLGATDKNVSALNKLPTVTQSGGNLVLTFQCLKDASRSSASLSVEHSSDLGISDAWLAALVTDAGTPANNVSFTVSSASATLNNVTATVSSSEAGGTGKLFGRLKTNNP